jgi:tetratricopeptide (TPR) repeat protein
VRPPLGIAGMAALIILALGHNLFSGVVNALWLAVPGLDKVLHIAGYAVLYVSLHALAGRSGIPRPHGLALATCIALSLADELLQSFIPSRGADVRDLAANAAGISIGWTIRRGLRDTAAIVTAALAVTAGAYLTLHTRATLGDYLTGLRYSQQHDFVKAREHYLRAYDAGHRFPGLLNELGWVEIESGVGDPQRAVAYAAQALALQPDNPDILDTYGWALHHAKRSREALAFLERAQAMKPNMYCIDYHLGEAYLAVDDRPRAEAHFRRQLLKTDAREAAFARLALQRMGVSPE